MTLLKQHCSKFSKTSKNLL